MRLCSSKIFTLLKRNIAILTSREPLNKSVTSPSRFCSYDFGSSLPNTATVLQNDEAAKVVVLGTVHFSKKSVEEVSQIVNALKPNAILVELCRQRVSLLELDDKKFLEDAKNFDSKKFSQTLKEHKGVVSGMLHAMLLKTYADLAKELGVAPGGEFRRAYQEMKKIPGCKLFLGDRPIQITISRAFQSLNMIELGQVFYHLSKTNQKPLELLFENHLRTILNNSRESNLHAMVLRMVLELARNQSASQTYFLYLESYQRLHERAYQTPYRNDKLQIEKYKSKEFVQSQFDEITREVPAFKKIFHVFVDERDRCLAYSLQECVRTVQDPRVLAVVGIGHINGISRYYGKMRQEDIIPLLL